MAGGSFFYNDVLPHSVLILVCGRATPATQHTGSGRPFIVLFSPGDYFGVLTRWFWQRFFAPVSGTVLRIEI